MDIHDAKCIRESDKAILVEASDFDEPQWIPKSQVTDESEVYKPGTDGVLIITDWWAEKQGWL